MFRPDQSREGSYEVARIDRFWQVQLESGLHSARAILGPCVRAERYGWNVSPTFRARVRICRIRS